MGNEMRLFRRFALVLVVIIIVCAFASRAARFLVVDEPQPSDVIIVLAGETHVRPARALQLLSQGMAPHVFIDAEQRNLIYAEQLVDILQRYLDTLPESSRVSVCPIYGFSTNAEVDDVSRCLQSMQAHRVLIVTSDYHTRRASMIFRHHLPQYQFSTAGARNSSEFGDAWWTNREWAKTTFDEWTKLIWWQAVDRWK
jgi:hypothetical protein